MAPEKSTMLEPDPSNWTVYEVVKFFCVTTRPDWAPVFPPLAPAAIGDALRANNISGYILLNFVNNTVLRDELKIGVFGDRLFVTTGIQWLQQRSLLFLSQHTQEDTQTLNPSVVGPATQLGANTPKAPRRIQPTPVTASFLPQQVSRRADSTFTDNDPLFTRILRKYPPKPDSDSDILPEFDSDTDENIELEENPTGEEAAHSTLKSTLLSDAEVSSELDAYVKSQRVKWQEHKLPRQKHRAYDLWIGRDTPDLNKAMSDEALYLRNRLVDLRKAVHRVEHNSRNSVHQTCGNLDQTIYDLCELEWKLGIIHSSHPPEKTKASNPRKKSAHTPREDSDGNETLGSDYSDLEDQDEMAKEKDNLDDFTSSDLNETESPLEEKPSQFGHFELVFADEEEFRDLELDEETASPSEGHVSKRPRLSMDIEFVDLTKTAPSSYDTAEPRYLPFDPDFPLPSNESDQATVRMVQSQNAEELDSDHLNDGSASIFDEVFPMMWKDIEKSGNREKLLAKYLVHLSNERVNKFSFYLGKYMESIYRTEVQDSLKAMSEDELVVNADDIQINYQKMMLGAFFVSWVNRIQLSDHGIDMVYVLVALKAMQAGTQGDGDDQSDEFSKFWTTLDSLLTEYQKWKYLEPSEPNEFAGNQNTTGRKRRKRKIAKSPLSKAQEQAQERQARQAEAKLALNQSLARAGVTNNDPTRKAISFKHPIIYLDARIGRYVKPHQLDGIRFMFREIVENKHPGGCLLAHTMGLGKTMQVISLLVTIAAAGASEDPGIRAQIPPELRKTKTLVLCPASLLQNWRDELFTWTPENSPLGKVFSIQSGTAGQSYSRFDQIKEWNDVGGILIISYDLFRAMVDNQSGMRGNPFTEGEHENVEQWLLSSPTLVVADEAHILRNKHSQTTRAASRFRTAKRIAMTGSPLANSLMDYYWMVDWVAPGFLDDPERFKINYLNRIENGSDFESTEVEQREALRALAILSNVLTPKINRADLSVLRDELPPKHEFTIIFELSQVQKDCYNLFVEAVREGTAAGMTSSIWSWIATLQLCCNHPWAFQKKLETLKSDTNDEGVVSSSNSEKTPITTEISRTILFKINNLLHEVPDIMDPSLSNRALLFKDIINESLKCGDKVLVFSQSVPTLDYLGRLLDRIGHSYCRMDGKTPAGDRQNATRKFNSGGVESVFLISTRAGGQGLNIQGANRIVIFDFLFNPIWEQQAVGRAYRFGQKKPVYVYRLVSGGTFEQLMHKKTLFKSELAVRVVDNLNVVRGGSRNTSRYLVNCADVECGKEINEEACAKDTNVMSKILHSEVAKKIVGVTVLDDRPEQGQQLTATELQSVEDELRLRRLGLDDWEKQYLPVRPPVPDEWSVNTSLRQRDISSL